MSRDDRARDEQVRLMMEAEEHRRRVDDLLAEAERRYLTDAAYKAEVYMEANVMMLAGVPREQAFRAALRLRAERDAAGLAVVPVGEPPPWMERAKVPCPACGGAGRTYDTDEAGDACMTCREDGFIAGALYRLTEGNDDV